MLMDSDGPRHSAFVEWTREPWLSAPSSPEMDPLIDPIILRYLVDEALDRGIPETEVREAMGHVLLAVVRSKVRVPYTQASEALCRLVRLIGDPDIGLIVGSAHRVLSWGLIALGAISCTTLGEAVAFGLRHQHAAGSLVSLRTRCVGHEASLLAFPILSDIGIERVLVEGVFASLVVSGRSLLGERLRLTAVEFVSQPKSSLARYEQVFQCPVRFGQRENRLIADLGVLDQAMNSPSLATWRMATSFLRKVGDDRVTEADLIQTIEAALQDSLSAPPSLVSLAQSLGMNERTLRRKLALENRNYHDMLDAIRRTRALEWLLLSGMPAAAVAQALGFSDLRSLGRAFKRWTGLSLHDRERA